MTKFRVVSLPGRGDPNPYVDLFYDALLPHGIELVGKLIFEETWLKDNLKNFDAIHLHWPEHLWRNYRTDSLKRLRTSGVPGGWRTANYVENHFRRYFNKKKIDWFEKNVLFLKGQGKKILYTWHNVEPHEGGSHVDWLGNQVLAENADLIIFHSSWAENECRKSHAIKAKTVIMPHGNYDGVYPPPRDRDVVARELGLDPALPTVGCLGAIREYKGVDVACDAVAQLGGAVQFLCAGKPYQEFDFESFRKKAEKSPGTVIVPRMITDQEFSDYANVCDALLLPYKVVTGSGALLAALTLGRGVVASDLPFFREILCGVPNAGFLVKPDNANELASGIEAYLNVPPEVRAKSARCLADNYNWRDVVLPVVAGLSSFR